MTTTLTTTLPHPTASAAPSAPIQPAAAPPAPASKPSLLQKLRHPRLGDKFEKLRPRRAPLAAAAPATAPAPGHAHPVQRFGAYRDRLAARLHRGRKPAAAQPSTFDPNRNPTGYAGQTWASRLWQQVKTVLRSGR